MLIQNAVPVRVSTTDGSIITTFCLLDPCCSTNIVSTELKEALNLHGSPRTLSVDTAIGNATMGSELVNINVGDVQGKNQYNIDCEVLPLTHLRDLHVPVKADFELFPQLKYLRGFRADIAAVTMIIGAKSHMLFTSTEIHQADNGLVISRIPLGHLFFGPSSAKYRDFSSELSLT